MGNAVYTFRTPWGINETCDVIKLTVESMKGTAKVVSPGRVTAKWKTQPSHSKQFRKAGKFTFYVGDGVVRAIGDPCVLSQKIFMHFKIGGQLAVWNAFIESLMTLAPGVDFGIRPGDLELVELQFVGDGLEETFVSRTRNHPSVGGAVLGGLAFGAAGAIIGGSAGTSYTTGKSSTRFATNVLAKGRYSNGLLAEGMMSRNSPAYQEIMVNMSRLS